MHEIETWINEAATATDIAVARQPSDVARNLLNNARTAFVQDNPRAWWLALRPPFKQFLSDEIGLTDVLPSTDSTCYLVPETETEELPVYEIDAKSVEVLLKECPYFEYYVFAKDLSWLVTEPDHNVFYVCERPPAVDAPRTPSS
jgi:hypothetical protein